MLFALEYCVDRNATRAYLASHPRCKSRKAAGSEGSRYLQTPKVAQFIERILAKKVEELDLSGDQVLRLIANHATGDIRRLFDGDEMLPPSEWPADVADCIKAVKPTKFGTSVTMYDKLAARVRLAEAAGVLGSGRGEAIKRKQTHDLADLLGDGPLMDDEAAAS